jgi:hypothetical protein
MTFYYCSCCISVGAEPEGYAELSGDYITYHKPSDAYISTGSGAPVTFAHDGKTLVTRTDIEMTVNDIDNYSISDSVMLT